MKTYLLIILSLLPISVRSQENVHFLINQDQTADCNYIKSGKFVNEKSDTETTEGYSIEFRGDYVLERIENGKYFVKSKITFTSDCAYNIKVLETTIPSYKDQIGKIFYTEILETAKVDKLIMIRTKGDEWTTFVLRKIEE